MDFEDSLPKACTELDSALLGLGFKYLEQDTEDSERRAYYIRKFSTDSSNVLLKVVLMFDLSISDDPYASYNENHEMVFNRAYIKVYNRQMEVLRKTRFGVEYDEDTAKSMLVDVYPIAPKSLDHLKGLLEILAAT
ncbi:MAG TPA: hypothetical protein PLL14_01010 [Accumulibacter sp.]|jgi:hypothetical protein|nr:hypothetical protein [Opitutaceae bacterium]MBP7372695.1 hypothetical protein [Opitutaceae bacterium]HOG02524.1 hypothetical protein [Accumulibacter sp.]